MWNEWKTKFIAALDGVAPQCAFRKKKIYIFTYIYVAPCSRPVPYSRHSPYSRHFVQHLLVLFQGFNDSL